MSTTTEHLRRRLESTDLSPDERAALQKALNTHGESFGGFFEGDRVTVKFGGTDYGLATVGNRAEFTKRFGATLLDHQEYVPVFLDRYGGSHINGYPANSVRRVNE